MNSFTFLYSFLPPVPFQIGLDELVLELKAGGFAEHEQVCPTG